MDGMARPSGGRRPAGRDRIVAPDDAETLAFRAAQAFGERFPAASAKRPLSLGESRFLAGLGTLLGAGLLLMPALTLVSLALVFFLVFAAIIVFRLAVLSVGAYVRITQGGVPDPPASDKSGWPVYTVLVPLYRESEVATEIIAALKSLDYPPRKLDIKLLLEADDAATLDAICEQRLGRHFEILVLPEGIPRTKPRALNYGLSLARGEFVTVYDAEDRIRKGQLKAAVAAFRNDAGKPGTSPLGCVQAPLRIDNGGDGWLAGQFAHEYAVHFELFLKGLSALRLPILLGGTSMHLPRHVLEDIGGWDAWNLTEDAELGLRLMLNGYRTGIIAPHTYEEAPVRFDVWLGQRSRWIHGFIQTWRAYCFQTRSIFSRVPILHWCTGHLLLASSVLTSLLHLPFALIVLWLLVSGLGLPTRASIALLTGGVALHLVSLIAVARLDGPRAVILAVTALLYWPLQTLAGMKALWGVLTSSYHWQKTEHGRARSRIDRRALARPG